MTWHSTSQVKGILWPWSIDPNYQEFKAFVLNIAVVNDAGERAMNVVQDLVMQATNKFKLQKMLVVNLDQLNNKVSSESEYEEKSSLDFLQEGGTALLDENEIVLSIVKTSYNLFLYIIHYLIHSIIFEELFRQNRYL